MTFVLLCQQLDLFENFYKGYAKIATFEINHFGLFIRKGKAVSVVLFS